MSSQAQPHDHPFWSSRQMIMAMLLAVAGLAAWWLLRTGTDARLQRPPRERLPDYIVEGLSAVETDAAGKPSRTLVAQELRHYVDEERSDLDAPRLVLFQTEGPPWRASSKSGTVFAGGDQVRLIGTVRIDREGDAKTRPTHLETEQVDIWRGQSLAATDLPVRIQSDGDSVTANGMRLWYSEPNRSTFHGRTRIRLAPEQESKP